MRRFIFPLNLLKLTMRENVKVVILMLAHDGVKNNCWKQWMESSSELGMICYISNINERNSMPASNIGNVFLASEKCLGMPSGWGEYSTTLVSIQLLLEALILFPNAHHFMHVSGRCLPISHSSTLLQWSENNAANSVFYIGCGNHFCAVEGCVYFTDEPAWKLTPQPSGSRLELNGKEYSSAIQTHAQWWILNRSHAELVRHFETCGRIDCLKNVDALFSGNMYKFKSNLRRRVVIAPDEYWILLILRLQGVSNHHLLFQHVCLYFMENQGDCNPITWTELDDPRRYYIVNPGETTMVMHSWMTLRQAILSSIRLFARTKNCSLFFFRKVEIGDASIEPWNWTESIQRITPTTASELPLVRNCIVKRTNNFQRKSTRALLTLYRTLQPLALTRRICLDKRERQRERKYKQVRINRRNRQFAQSLSSSNTWRK